MNIPTSIAGILVVLLAVLPGVPADRAYRVFAGVSWREREVEYFLRLVSFSVLGLAVYVLLAPVLGMPPPTYVIPATFSAADFGPASLRPLAMAYIGHASSSVLIGVALGGSIASLRRITRGRIGQRDAWYHFIHVAAPRRWVIVKVRTGESYLGFIEHSDVAVEPQYRDVILVEPYLWNEDRKTYLPTFNQFLFLQGADVVSVAVAHDAAKDKRIMPAAETPFSEEANHG
jgi:hypothetical protein